MNDDHLRCRTTTFTRGRMSHGLVLVTLKSRFLSAYTAQTRNMHRISPIYSYPTSLRRHLFTWQIVLCALKVSDEASATPATLPTTRWPACSSWRVQCSSCWPFCCYPLQQYSLSAGAMGLEPPASSWQENCPRCVKRPDFRHLPVREKTSPELNVSGKIAKMRSTNGNIAPMLSRLFGG